MLRTNPTVLAALALSFASLGPLAGILRQPSSRSRAPLADGETTIVVSDVVHTEWRCVDGRASLWVVGTVTVQNTGDDETDGLRLRAILEHASEPGAWSYDVGGLDLAAAPIAPGDTFEHHYAYETDGWPPHAEYRHSVAVLLSNRSDHAPRQTPASSGRSLGPPFQACPTS
jgi:hypothetical protein